MRNNRVKRRRPASPAGAETAPRTVRRRTVALVLFAFALVFIGLEVNGYTRKSATWDEPMHLTSGYVALAHHDYRVDPSHPPLVRMWAALPLLAARPTVDMAAIDRAALPDWLSEAYAFAHEFLYVQNDADRLLYAGRFMVVLLGVVLGVLLFSWVDEWLGLVPAIGALVLYAVEPNLVAHASLVTTDLGVTCFMFGAVYFTWRTTRRPSVANIAAVAIFSALAMVTKFSAVLLIPILAALIIVAVRRGTMTPRTASIVAVSAAVASFVAIWVAYGFSYQGGPANSWSFRVAGTEMASGAPALTAVVDWFDRYRLLPRTFLQGFLYNQSSVGNLNAYLAGRYSTDGWWYYFPFAFAIKTPIALMALFGAGVFFLATRRSRARPAIAAFVIVPIAVYLGVAMVSGVNIGLRHILPVYPFVILVAAAAIKALAASRHRTGLAVVGVLLVAAVAEFATAYPYPLTFFNQFVGGPQNGFRHLSDSNLAWGQGLKPLKKWMDDHAVAHVNLAYFGQADPAYYGMQTTRLPGAPDYAVTTITRPRLPGYVAIGSTVLSGVYLRPSWRLFYKPFQDLVPTAVVGNSIRVYWVDEWPEMSDEAAEQVPPEVQASLADGLLFGQRWPDHAVVHYRKSLKRRPNHVPTIVNSAIALVRAGDLDEATRVLYRAVEIDPRHGGARLTLAEALFAGRNMSAADMHAREALILRPRDPVVHELLGRLRAVQGRRDEAARYFRQALAIDPSFEDARRNLAYVSAKQR